ncbi:hypothetical protein CF326_g6412 [Tilletia indica]|nr:hypothetical protein CF326_g6412 [Tilletia indica]
MSTRSNTTIGDEDSTSTAGAESHHRNHGRSHNSHSHPQTRSNPHSEHAAHGRDPTGFFERGAGTPSDRGGQTKGEVRLDEDAGNKRHWKRWGPYLAERQWATVREDYSANGEAWFHFPHEHARSRAFRWGEDSLASLGDNTVALASAWRFGTANHRHSIRISAYSRGPDPADIHLIPQLVFRNTWSWPKETPPEPELKQVHDYTIQITHERMDNSFLQCFTSPAPSYPPKRRGAAPEPVNDEEVASTLMLTEKETNLERLYDVKNKNAFAKDAFHDEIEDKKLAPPSDSPSQDYGEEAPHENGQAAENAEQGHDDEEEEHEIGEETEVLLTDYDDKDGSQAAKIRKKAELSGRQLSQDDGKGIFSPAQSFSAVLSPPQKRHRHPYWPSRHLLFGYSYFKADLNGNFANKLDVDVDIFYVFFYHDHSFVTASSASSTSTSNSSTSTATSTSASPAASISAFAPDGAATSCCINLARDK